MYNMEILPEAAFKKRAFRAESIILIAINKIVLRGVWICIVEDIILIVRYCVGSSQSEIVLQSHV